MWTIINHEATQINCWYKIHKSDNQRVSIQIITSSLSDQQLNITSNYHQDSIWHITRVQLFIYHQSTHLHHISKMSSGYLWSKTNMLYIYEYRSCYTTDIYLLPSPLLVKSHTRVSLAVFYINQNRISIEFIMVN